MRTLGLAVVLGLVLTLPASAESLDGREIAMKAGAVQSRHVPLTLPCDAEADDSIISVREPKTGQSFPATLRNGELVFVSEGANPGTEHTYVVDVDAKSAAYAPKVRIEKRDGEEALDVFIEDVLFTAYHYSNDAKKPYLWPVMSEGQLTVTRDWPMKDEVEVVGRSKEKDIEFCKEKAKDHPHHKSLWVAYGELNDVDCWAEGDNSGFQHSGEVTWGSGDAYGWIRAANVWRDKDHQPVINETREYRFFATPEKARLLDTFVTLSADYGDVHFGDTKEGGIVAVRMRPELSNKWAKITNALGDEGEFKAWGKPSPWCDYSGDLEGYGYRGLAVFDHPTNFRYPTCWHVRNYGLMGANCFGYSYFSEKDYNKGLIPENGEYDLAKGEKLEWHHRVYVHSGDAEKAAVADRFADFATPPEVSWAK